MVVKDAHFHCLKLQVHTHCCPLLLQHLGYIAVKLAAGVQVGQLEGLLSLYPASSSRRLDSSGLYAR